ncbi:hypothetical protein JCM19235_5603 [Vibrio maritimus]|uniref:Uncharacterized protein n=1 Tax=Vibrio maritimus TaxID=990268 RepID=A0A090RS83_9VIBR|nr:hypothetical protein JCM19235_5603 [Vibrio maritimus]
MIRAFIVALLSGTVSLVFAYLSINNELEVSASQSTAKIDQQIEDILKIIDDLPSDPSCPDEVKREYADIAHENERIRAVGYVFDAGEQWHVCSMFGRTLSKLNYWSGAKVEDVFVGRSLLTVHFPETSFVVGKESGNLKAFAYVNPRRVLGYWIEPSLPYANYSLRLDGENVPAYTRAPVELQSMLLKSAHSKKYPYSIQSAASIVDMLKRAGVYWLRLLIAIFFICSSFGLLRRSILKPT